MLKKKRKRKRKRKYNFVDEKIMVSLSNYLFIYQISDVTSLASIPREV
jgi:hypothetical protein